MECGANHMMWRYAHTRRNRITLQLSGIWYNKVFYVRFINDFQCCNYLCYFFLMRKRLVQNKIQVFYIIHNTHQFIELSLYHIHMFDFLHMIWWMTSFCFLHHLSPLFLTRLARRSFIPPFRLASTSEEIFSSSVLNHNGHHMIMDIICSCTPKSVRRRTSCGSKKHRESDLMADTASIEL